MQVSFDLPFEVEHLDIYELERLRDAVNRRILSMRRTTGLDLSELLRLLEEVKQTLSDQGKTWHSLERWTWMDGEIKFWLNPDDQINYQSGWFSIDELIAWAHDAGSVMRYEEDPDETLCEKHVEIAWLPRTTVPENRLSLLLSHDRSSQ